MEQNQDSLVTQSELTPEQREVVETVAGLDAIDTPAGKICQIAGINETTLAGLRNLPEYKKLLSEFIAEKANQTHDINQGWDSVEQRAIEVVQEKLKHSHDGEFALKAAAVANKAKRTPVGREHVGPIDGNGASGTTINISLNNNFAKKLPSLDIIGKMNEVKDKVQQDKSEDGVEPAELEKLLRERSQLKLETAGEFSDNLFTGFADAVAGN